MENTLQSVLYNEISSLLENMYDEINVICISIID